MRFTLAMRLVKRVQDTLHVAVKQVVNQLVDGNSFVRSFEKLNANSSFRGALLIFHILKIRRNLQERQRPASRCWNVLDSALRAALGGARVFFDDRASCRPGEVDPLPRRLPRVVGLNDR